MGRLQVHCPVSKLLDSMGAAVENPCLAKLVRKRAAGSLSYAGKAGHVMNELELDGPKAPWLSALGVNGAHVQPGSNTFQTKRTTDATKTQQNTLQTQRKITRPTSKNHNSITNPCAAAPTEQSELLATVLNPKIDDQHKS